MSHFAYLDADKGSVLIYSAGNSGRGTWNKITPPGDAENVITVGAPFRNLVNGDFCCVGNSTDGSVKPDVMCGGSCFDRIGYMMERFVITMVFDSHSVHYAGWSLVCGRLVRGLHPSRWWRQCGMQETVKSFRIICTVMVCVLYAKLVK